MLSIKHRISGETLKEVDSTKLEDGRLAGAQLAGADLHFAALYRADLRECDLHGAFLMDADLAEARLQASDLRDANCRRVDLRGTDLSGANLARADLREANLAGARLSGARLEGAAFTGIVLSDATFDPATRWPSGLDPQRYGARRAPPREEPVRRDEDRWDDEGGLVGDSGGREGGVGASLATPGADGDTRRSALGPFEEAENPPQHELVDLVRLASLICNVPMAILSVLDAERQWFAAGPDGAPVPDGHCFIPCVALTAEGVVVASASGGVGSGGVGSGGVGSGVRGQVIRGPRYPIRGRLPVAPTGAHILGMLSAVLPPPPLDSGQSEALEILARQGVAHFQLSRSHRDLQKFEELRDRLTEMIVHDLRQPLQSLMGGLHSLGLLGPLNGDQEELLRISVAGGEDLLRMINELLDISKMESGTLRLDYSPVRCEQLIAVSLRQLAPLAAQKELQMLAEVEPGLPPVDGDAEKLGRTIVNLIGNAIKFTPCGGTIEVRARLGDDGASVCLSVADTGEGIPADSFALIFEKFGQVESRARGHRMSSGLGLTFCKMIVEAHGGSIRVESDLGSGSTFFVVLPFRRCCPVPSDR